MIGCPSPQISEVIDVTQLASLGPDGIILPAEIALSSYVVDIIDYTDKLIREAEQRVKPKLEKIDGSLVKLCNSINESV